mmetsp:Transcript_53739/g.80190  ORF Transcript_53739/g.80190 Transcript_53739/m.80190 type:complete len:201 (+) Transcript_53739:1849-2451(+)
MEVSLVEITMGEMVGSGKAPTSNVVLGQRMKSWPTPASFACLTAVDKTSHSLKQSPPKDGAAEEGNVEGIGLIPDGATEGASERGADVGGKVEIGQSSASNERHSPVASSNISSQPVPFPATLSNPKFSTLALMVESVSMKTMPLGSVAVLRKKHDSNKDKDPPDPVAIAACSAEFMSKTEEKTVVLLPIVARAAQDSLF